MPNIKSAKKRMRTSAKSEERNRSLKTRITTTRRKVMEAAAAGDKAKGEAAFKDYCSILDRAAKAGTIKKNNASRRKSRAALRLAAIA